MAAAEGASLKELMERMGHSSPRAALIYLHATRERDQKIAAGMGRLFTEARNAGTKKTGNTPKPSGTQRHDAPSELRRSAAKSSEEYRLPAVISRERMTGIEPA
jgi:hypothetical protein